MRKDAEFPFVHEPEKLDPEKDREILHRIFESAPDGILLVDATGRIVRANPQAERMFGYGGGELIGQLVEVLVPERFGERHVHHRRGYHGSPHRRPMGVGLELFGRRRDGSEFPVDIMLSPLEQERGSLVLGVVRDVTERKRVEAQARAVKEMHFREVHHRVKNNLQVISALLYLQSTYTSDPNAQTVLHESQNRVKSIALVHEKLYRSAELTGLDFADYVRDLVADLVRSYGFTRERVRVDTRVYGVNLDVDTAIPCGLLINELVTNALKHAFPGGRGGELRVEVTPAEQGGYVLLVRDDGVGLPEDFDVLAGASLGLKLVSDLTRQLDGKLHIESGSGTLFRIEFRPLQYKDRS